MIVRPFVCAAALLLAGSAGAYPGGTPDYQTDVAPFCAACHASRSAEMLEGAGERATKELAANKHLAVIEAAQPDTPYAKLPEADRARLVAHIRALDEASTVTLEAPDAVGPGESFTVTVEVTGGAGPVVGVGLVDRDHRWWARPAASAGWQVVDVPRVLGPDGNPQSEWLEKRPQEAGRNLSFVNVQGVRSDAAQGVWATAKVRFSLRAPEEPGSYPLAAVFLYGTEKGSPLGTVKDPLGFSRNLGGLAAASGRILFTPVKRIQVE